MTLYLLIRINEKVAATRYEATEILDPEKESNHNPERMTAKIVVLARRLLIINNKDE